jgi:hypothetical protein
MRYLLNLSGVAIASTAIVAIGPSAVAQKITYTVTCQAIGGSAPEPL